MLGNKKFWMVNYGRFTETLTGLEDLLRRESM